MLHRIIVAPVKVFDNKHVHPSKEDVFFMPVLEPEKAYRAQWPFEIIPEMPCWFETDDDQAWRDLLFFSTSCAELVRLENKQAVFLERPGTQSVTFSMDDLPQVHIAEFVVPVPASMKRIARR